MKHLFITGFVRSGTTLLEKYLHNHPEMAVASQPFPFLYYEFKKRFYQHLGVEPPAYPMGHLFHETLYTRQQFQDFMATYRLDADTVRGVMDGMRDYSGQLTPSILDVEPRAGTLHEIYQYYTACLPHLFSKPKTRAVGSKEVFCEEFIPYFLAQGMPVVLVIRDPRATIASIHGGQGSNYVSRRLALLHIVRSWRKSVAYAMHFSGHSGFHWIRYEDLVRTPDVCLQPLARMLDIAPFPESVFIEPLADQNGKPWQGNSSFSLSSTAVDTPRYRELLDNELIAFVDTLSSAEMSWLGLPHTPQKNIDKVLDSFLDPFQPDQPRLDLGDKRLERERLNKIQATSEQDEDAESWFIFSDIQAHLQNAVSRN